MWKFYHNCHIIIVYTVVVDWRLQEMRIFFQPVIVSFKAIDSMTQTHHSGTFSGLESIVVNAWYMANALVLRPS